MNGEEALNPLVNGNDDPIDAGGTSPRIALHRLSAVRRAKGIPRRVLAERLGISPRELRAKEESPDLSISTLFHWASVLNVPITDLVVEPDECLSPTRLARSQAARLMKVAAKLRDRTRRRSIQRLAQTFVEQLAEILPALEQLAKKNHRHPKRAKRSPPSATPGPRSEPRCDRRPELGES